MRQPKMYIETSVFNFVFADDAPDKRDDAVALFAEIEQGKYAPYTSAYVLEELNQAPEPKRNDMLQLISRYKIEILTGRDEAEKLAGIYVAEGVIPSKFYADALHIAIATVNDLSLIVSFNFKHIVKLKTVTMTEVINLREGYNRIGIFSPTEVIDNG